jgi:hypothetical protein
LLLIDLENIAYVPRYNERLYKLWQGQKPPRSSVPSISRLQSLIEQAWSQGFDIQGSEQLGCRLVNTRKWIGATEVVTLLSFLRIKCQLVDFHRPTGPGGAHPELFNWVMKYFENGIGGEFTPPLYLQHQGNRGFEGPAECSNPTRLFCSVQATVGPSWA